LSHDALSGHASLSYKLLIHHINYRSMTSKLRKIHCSVSITGSQRYAVILSIKMTYEYNNKAFDILTIRKVV